MTVAIVLHRANGAPVSTTFRKAAFGKNDPFARHREIAWEGPGSMSAGRTSFIGELEVPSFPHCAAAAAEPNNPGITPLRAGSVRFAAPDGSVLSVGTGDALFVPQGAPAPIGWESRHPVAKFCAVQGVPA